MIVVFSCSLLALFLTYLDSKGKLKGGMKIGFLITGALAVIHYDFGNDYMPYFRTYMSIFKGGYSWEQIVNDQIIRNNEFGWGLINLLFTPFGKYGFFVLVAALSIVEAYAYYYTIKRFVDKDWWWLAVFTYLFVGSLYLLNFSLLRQGLVISLFVLITPWIIQKKFIRCLIIIVGLSTIHTSALILLPFVFLPFLYNIRAKVLMIVICSLFVAFFFMRSFMEDIFSSFMAVEQFANYAVTYSAAMGTVKTYGLGFILKLIPFVVILVFLAKHKRLSKNDFVLIVLSCIGYIVIPFAELLPTISRVSLYFSAFSIFTIPLTYKWIEDAIIRNSLLLLYILFVAYDYFLFFSNPVWIEHYSTYKTIFEVI